MDFMGFPKMARLSRDVIITEKIDGTHAQIYIEVAPFGGNLQDALGRFTAGAVDFYLWAGSRTRWMTPWNDNYGFAQWASEHAPELVKLGPGSHFGEWWGRGIQRGYGLTEKRFSLFQTERWSDPEQRPACCGVVPVLFRGEFDTTSIKSHLEALAVHGSHAAPGFMNPEGIVVWHTAANIGFKKTIHGDEKPKSLDKPAQRG